ncbi:NADH-quinone oxidoreductase subunit NuoH [Tautonia sociabilis]|uniref:NADH-quinone oxidoreductase subunit H n=1 Tax=Tautonia sociabilis TaxID=2080755 RepID=A0A432MHU6_9BACT|nr:NADH-quinone oxidoreductase subunit NuoH [Tautonia sociabilis]RUL86487.1 NADH-quinone oxidoreductase subunit NuoH [Tautonia sociabilis]
MNVPIAPVRPELAGPTWIPWLLWLVVFFGLLPLAVAYIVLAERKVAGRFQDRIGPNRVGPFGLLQPIADLLKLITKENIVPRAADAVTHLLGPVLLIVSAFLVLAVIPFGVSGSRAEVAPFGAVSPAEGSRLGYPGLAAVDTASGLLYLVAAASLSVLGVFLAGWSSRNKFALLGSMRGVAQLVSYEIPQVLSLVPAILWASSLSLVGIFNAQVDQGWFLGSPPGIVAFVVLMIASIAETNRAPFDLPEAESELIAGYHTEYSGMRWGLFFLAEYLAIIGVSCLATTLFLGGGMLPFTSWPLGAIDSVVLVNLVLVGGFVAKVALIIFVIFWIRATLPRMRVDRLMGFAWKILIPLCLVNIVAAAVWLELAVRRDRPLLGWLVTLPPLVLALAALVRLSRREGPAPVVGRDRLVRTPAAIPGVGGRDPS